MITYTFLQQYWWAIISLLGALLVFLLFVQGGQTLLFGAKDEMQRTMMVNSLGRKWELTYTTLVTFGGAFFASFPLFYSTSFGGAYWLWMLILVSFVLQAVSYEFRSKAGNLFGKRTYDAFLFFNGIVGCILLGVAVAGFFFGGEFTISKSNILNASSPIISQWSSTHGLEAIFSLKNLLLGVVVLFLARVQASLYFINNISDEALIARQRKAVLVNGLVFAVLFVAFVLVLLLSDGHTADGLLVKNKYFHNLIQMWWVLVMFLAGVVAVLWAIGRTAYGSVWRKGIWFSGAGTVLVVLSLFFIAGYNNTAYYPSTIDPSCSLSIANSCSSEFTLFTMAIASLFIPFVLAYIIYVWRKMDGSGITVEEMASTDHKY